MRKISIALSFILLACGGAKQNLTQDVNPAKTINQDTFRVAFYNVENLFDTLDDNKIADEEFTPNSELHWNTEIYTNKLKNLAQVISDLNADILGLAEVENKQVIIDLLGMLPKKKYKIVHYNSPDERGIDVALVYNTDKFTNLTSRPIQVYLNDTNKTRDILEVKLKNIISEESITVFVNHWPSKRGGVEMTNPYRAAAAMVLKKAMKSTDTKTIAIGDFNDGPKDSSLLHVLNSGYPGDTFNKIEFYNFARFIKTSKEGSHQYKGKWEMLDQMIVSKDIWHAVKGTCFIPWSFKLYNPSYVFENEGKYKGYPKRGVSRSNWVNGYSDHLAIFADFISYK